MSTATDLTARQSDKRGGNELLQAPTRKGNAAKSGTVTLTTQEVDELNRFIEAFNDVTDRILIRLDRIHTLIQDINRDLHAATLSISET